MLNGRTLGRTAGTGNNAKLEKKKASAGISVDIVLMSSIGQPSGGAQIGIAEGVVACVPATSINQVL